MYQIYIKIWIVDELIHNRTKHFIAMRALGGFHRHILFGRLQLNIWQELNTGSLVTIVTIVLRYFNGNDMYKMIWNIYYALLPGMQHTSSVVNISRMKYMEPSAPAMKYKGFHRKGSHLQCKTTRHIITTDYAQTPELHGTMINTRGYGRDSRYVHWIAS